MPTEASSLQNAQNIFERGLHATIKQCWRTAPQNKENAKGGASGDTEPRYNSFVSRCRKRHNTSGAVTLGSFETLPCVCKTRSAGCVVAARQRPHTKLSPVSRTIVADVEPNFFSGNHHVTTKIQDQTPDEGMPPRFCDMLGYSPRAPLSALSQVRIPAI